MPDDNARSRATRKWRNRLETGGIKYTQIPLSAGVLAELDRRAEAMGITGTAGKRRAEVIERLCWLIQHNSLHPQRPPQDVQRLGGQILR